MLFPRLKAKIQYGDSHITELTSDLHFYECKFHTHVHAQNNIQVG